MKVELCFTAQELNPSLVYGKTVIILDVFRASSTIITALYQGATKIIPVTTPPKALSLKKRDPAVILAGEKNGFKIKGFHLGNSPLEYNAQIIKDRTIILVTTNGTPAIYQAQDAAALYIGSFLNAPALAAELKTKKNDLLLVCAGTQGEYSLEDTCCAGYFLHLLQNITKPYLNDKTLGALALYHSYCQNLPYNLSKSQNGRALLAQGYGHDIEYCCSQKSLPTLPLYRDTAIIDLNNRKQEDK